MPDRHIEASRGHESSTSDRVAALVAGNKEKQQHLQVMMPAPLYRDLRIQAAREGISLKQLAINAFVAAYPDLPCLSGDE